MKYGEIIWDLSARTEYMLSTELPCRLVLANPSTTPRRYRITLVALDSSGNALTLGNVTVDDKEWIVLNAGQAIQVPGYLVLGVTDCMLELVLYEEDRDEVVDSCYTHLYSPQDIITPVLALAMITAMNTAKVALFG